MIKKNNKVKILLLGLLAVVSVIGIASFSTSVARNLSEIDIHAMCSTGKYFGFLNIFIS
ncbi:hypothetical protein [Clostridium hydrogenum]|uniref:hypothetical protein n=1 Tax=Clostridium hydrogenum TaxID=2855764 RepID=UPI001F472708|nr:hypothetical protein [Clostridium hydrogenum]